ncbi:hypothetical protein EDD18DRAFT_1111443 [Armillaria luteobubalina]|uniref:Uncharacterized protein n=1 Tax=Armillaria luteobubalina TaxID=153913 RepID=A0AA39PKZ8_9AGAR|nr:hypothetical protein EDD18DRAFT_1111443 [Armillaria luteobubalina]
MFHEQYDSCRGPPRLYFAWTSMHRNCTAHALGGTFHHDSESIIGSNGLRERLRARMASQYEMFHVRKKQALCDLLNWPRIKMPGAGYLERVGDRRILKISSAVWMVPNERRQRNPCDRDITELRAMTQGIPRFHSDGSMIHDQREEWDTMGGDHWDHLRDVWIIDRDSEQFCSSSTIDNYTGPQHLAGEVYQPPRVANATKYPGGRTRVGSVNREE